MYYINALEIINKAIELEILKTEDGKVFILKEVNSEEVWFLQDKESLAQELMNSVKGQKILMDSILKIDPNFKPSDYSYLENLHPERLYLMIWLDETETWEYYHYDEIPDESELDVLYPNGYVPYYIVVKNDKIISDDYSEERIGLCFETVYKDSFKRKKSIYLDEN